MESSKVIDQTNAQVQVNKRVVFCAAHHIPGAGKCERNHGHNWVANISVTKVSGELDEQGFIVDVRDLKEAAFKYDHDDLNNYFEVPSTENVCQKIANDALELCQGHNPDAVFTVNVHLVETENNSASASATNFVWAAPQMTQNSFEDLKKKALDEEAAWAVGSQVTAQPTHKKFIKRSKV